jgi:CHAT domain-containing protein
VGGLPGWDDVAHRLYTQLIAPVGPIRPGQRIAIIEGGLLSRLPFDILGRKGGVRLGREHAISLVASLLPTAPRPGSPTASRALVVGVSKGGLPKAEVEANIVGNRLAVRPLLGADATTERLQAAIPSAPLIHFATHGVISPTNPYDSRIETGSDDGGIRGWWLFQQALRADLVVLSACETGRADRIYGELVHASGGDASLAEAFHAAGARQVIASLWKIWDDQAVVLMRYLYVFLSNPDVGVPEALQRAKLATVDEGSAAEFHVAAFQLSVASMSDLSK